jgi:hypothetical protein
LQFRRALSPASVPNSREPGSTSYDLGLLDIGKKTRHQVTDSAEPGHTPALA